MNIENEEAQHIVDVDYEIRREEARRELAYRFANQKDTSDAATDEIADML